MIAPILPAAEVVVEGADRQEWLAARGYGGSTIAAILGLSPHATPVTAYLERTGQLPEEEPHEAMRWGTRLEQPIADGFSEETGIPTFQPPPITMYRSKELALATCSPDRFIGTDLDGMGIAFGVPRVDGLYEGKMTSAYLAENWKDEDGKTKAPVWYEAQVVWNLGVLGLPYAELVALIGGNRLVHIHIEASPEIFADMLHTVEMFERDCVEARQIPEVDGSYTTTRALKRAFESVVEDEVELPVQFLVHAEARADMAARVKQLEEQIARIDNDFRAAMGEHKVAVHAGQKIASYPLIPAKRVEAHDVAAYRRLTISRPKEAK